MEEQKELLTFEDLLRDNIIPNVEKIAAILLVIAGVIFLLGSSGYIEMLTVSLSTLATSYFINASLYAKKTTGFFERIVIKIGFTSSSVTIIGFMFSILKLPGDSIMLSIGTGVLGLAVVLSIYGLLYADNQQFKTLLIKFGLVLLLGISTYF